MVGDCSTGKMENMDLLQWCHFVLLNTRKKTHFYEIQESIAKTSSLSIPQGKHTNKQNHPQVNKIDSIVEISLQLCILFC